VNIAVVLSAKHHRIQSKEDTATLLVATANYYNFLQKQSSTCTDAERTNTRYDGYAIVMCNLKKYLIGNI